MSDMAPEPRHARLSVFRAVLRENPVLVGIAGIGFFVSFQTIARLAQSQHMPGWPVLYPLLIDLGILGFIVEARKAIDDRRSDLVPRFLAWALAGLTIYVNAHGSPARDWLGVTLHVVAPALWVAFLELTRWRKLRKARELRDPIPRMRWVLSPLATFRLWRRMVLWGVTSYSEAVAMELSRRQAIAKLTAFYKRENWRKAAPGDLAWMLRTGVRMEQALAMVGELTAPAVPAAIRAARPNAPAKRKRTAPAKGRANAGMPADFDAQAAALALVSQRPGISGAELGEAVGRSARWGQLFMKDLREAPSTGPIQRVEAS